MQQCHSAGCDNYTTNRGDFCLPCIEALAPQPISITPASINFQADSVRFTESNKDSSSGGDNDYWIARITQPKRLVPYDAECEDLIEHFQMTFQEGEAFKALWRKGQARIGNGKPGDNPLRNAQKIRHFGARIEVMEERLL